MVVETSRNHHPASRHMELPSEEAKRKATEHLAKRHNISLKVVRAHVKAGDNSFVVAAATLWNALPNNIKTSACLATFKARLKAHFFLTVLAA